MELFNIQGVRLAIDGEKWRELLDVACEHGWQPRGTQAPPVPIEEGSRGSWPGGYTRPCGQVVARPDAACLANAIEAASLPPNPFQANSLGNLSDAVEFFRSGPFLIAEDPRLDRSEPDAWWEQRRSEVRQDRAHQPTQADHEVGQAPWPAAGS